jgi:hypothetical protein
MFSDHAHAPDANHGNAKDLRLIRLRMMAQTRVRKRTQVWECPLWKDVTSLTDDRKAPEERA